MTREVESVLRKVANRQGLRALGRAAFRWTCAFGAAYALVLLGGRLLALWPDPFGPDAGLTRWSLLAVPILGLLAGLLTHRRADLAGAARATDGFLDTKDLFLTSLAGAGAPGEYQPLVEAHARRESARVPAAEVAPLPFQRRTAQVLLGLAVLWSATVYLPALDPFGSDAERLELAQRRARLVVEEKRTTERKQALQAKPLDQPTSQAVRKALQEVAEAFRKMQRNQRRANDQRLEQSQKAVSAQWREARAKSQNQGTPSASLQSLGKLADPKQAEAWRKDLQAGKTDSLRRELSDLRDKLREIANEKDAKRREQLRRELQERTKGLGDFLKSQASSRELNKTLSRALEQLQAMANPQLEKQARDALRQTLELSELELKNLAQSLRDLKALEDALKALQAARGANAKGGQKGDEKGAGKGGKGAGEPGLDGGMTPQLEGMRAYEEYYRKLLEELGEQGEPGGGMQGPGRGAGGEAPEDPAQKNKFKTEKALSALRAGRILMTLKTKEVGDRGKVEVDYAEQLQQVKQGVGEAILQERVPAGYHDAIKKYFDQLGGTADRSKAPKPSADPKKK